MKENDFKIPLKSDQSVLIMCRQQVAKCIPEQQLVNSGPF